MKAKIQFKIILLVSFISNLLAQPGDFPEDPYQSPIGGLALLTIAGAFLAYSKLSNRK